MSFHWCLDIEILAYKCIMPVFNEFNDDALQNYSTFKEQLI